jgi:predicted membrane channel-forming protein YqfA (hemolysin III family)
MTHTRYSPGNVALLVIGALIGCISVFMSIMTAGFGADPVHDFSSFAFVAFLVLSFLLVPVYLIMFRWCSVGAIAMWCLLVGCLVVLVAGFGFKRIGLLVLLFIEALIFEAINSRSRAESSPNDEPS